MTSIGGKLKISGNNNLWFLTGLDNLTTIGGDFEIWNNQVLHNLTGLGGLTSIGGNLSIHSMNSAYFTNFIGLEGLTTIGGYLNISGNYSLTSLIGLEGLTSIGGDLYITQNGLTSLSGLENIEANTPFNLTITDNSNLSDCEIQGICNYLASPNGTVDIGWNHTGCNSVVELGSSCGGSLPCLPYGNYNFLSQDDIDNFQTVFPECKQLEGSVRIWGDNITNLNGLNTLSIIGGDLHIGYDTYWGSGNPELTSLSGLESLTAVGGGLEIFANASLTDITGLQGLTSVGSGLKINNNSSMTNLSGLENLDGGTITDLLIFNNTLLSTCEVQSICNYLKSPNGTVEIYGNAPGCSSQEEVEAACLVGVGQLDNWTVGQSSVDCYPNPTSGIVDFRWSMVDVRWVSLKVNNAQGQEVAVLLDQKMAAGEHTIQWNASGLPAGIYFYKLRAKGLGQVGAGKIVKY